MKSDILRSLLQDIAVGFCLLTRLPMPKLPPSAFDRSARAVWTYPVVGLTVGLVAMIAFIGSRWVGLPAAVAAGVALTMMTVMTGAMHEDGLSDLADGFWGGHDSQQRLSIMKDSQIGTYGTLALIFAIGLRWVCYALLLSVSAAAALMVAAPVSRAMMPVVMAVLPNARGSGLSHGVGRPAPLPVCIGLGLAFLAAFLISGPLAVAAFMAAGVTAAAMCWLSHRKIGGQTGDVLGATQQLSEIAILLTFVAAMSH